MASNRIQVLPIHIANQIAAGEVIERPVSVVKELMENSLDAGATEMSLDIENGGMGLIRIKDNGKGMFKEDLPLALARHATSKIQQAEDLFKIQSLGFRGEALASIASVSKVRIQSREASQEKAWEIRTEGTVMSEVMPCAHAVGTTIEVRDLFYNIPVRRKFLKSEKTEFNHILGLVKKFALSHPEVSLVLKNNGIRIKAYSAVQGSLSQENRVKALCGSKFLHHAAFIQARYHEFELTGWAGSAEAARRHADCQYFFINRRMVKDKLVNHAIKSAYQYSLGDLSGLFPSYILYLTLPNHALDVNVHPTKHEVRFVESSLVHDFIEKCLKEALGGKTSPLIEAPVSGQSSCRRAVSLIQPQVKTHAQGITSTQLYPQEGNRFYYLEREEFLYLIDMDQAAEFLLERYLKNHADQILNKPLLFPMQLELNHTLSQDHAQRLKSLGFAWRVDGQSFWITHVPFCLQRGECLKNVILECFSSNPQTLSEGISLLKPHFDPAAYQMLSPSWVKDTLMGWINTREQGPWLRLNKAQVLEKMQLLTLKQGTSLKTQSHAQK